MKKKTLVLSIFLMSFLVAPAQADISAVGLQLGQKIGEKLGDSIRGYFWGNGDEVETKDEKNENPIKPLSDASMCKLPAVSKEITIIQPQLKLGSYNIEGISEKELPNVVASYIAGNSKYANFKFETSKNLIFDIWTTPKITVTSSVDENHINIIYHMNETKKTQTLGGRWTENTSATTTFTIPLNYSTVKEAGKLKITFKTVDAATVESKKAPEFIVEQTELIDDVMANLTLAINKLQNQKVERFLNIKGEINTNFNDASTFANFERILGFYSWNGNQPGNIDLIKEKYFNFKLANNAVVPLHVKVYPYKNGSKVVYDMPIEYKIAMDGSIDIPTKDFDQIKQEIVKVAND